MKKFFFLCLFSILALSACAVRHDDIRVKILSTNCVALAGCQNSKLFYKVGDTVMLTGQDFSPNFSGTMDWELGSSAAALKRDTVISYRRSDDVVVWKYYRRAVIQTIN